MSVLFLIRSSDQMFCGGNIIGREQQRARSLIKMMRMINIILMISVKMMIVMIIMVCGFGISIAAKHYLLTRMMMMMVTM